MFFEAKLHIQEENTKGLLYFLQMATKRVLVVGDMYSQCSVNFLKFFLRNHQRVFLLSKMKPSSQNIFMYL
jgi:hypothetical protein